MKEFNTAAKCIPSRHYMVNIADKVAEIRQLVDAGRYFAVNRARQFGKTTILTALAHDLAPRYIVSASALKESEMPDFRTKRRL